MDWAKRESMRTGETVNQVLQRLVDENGGKWELIGKACGMTHSGACVMFKRHGFVKKPCRNFEYHGATTSLLQHCKRLGIEYFTLRNYCYRHNCTPIQALDAYREGRVVRNYWGRPQLGA